MIDTHCHLTFADLAQRVDRVIADAHAAGVDRMITIGTTLADSPQAVELAQRYDSVHAAVGVHPHHASQYGQQSALCDQLDELVRKPGVAAIGEMGLDTHYTDPPLDVQQRVLASQLRWIASLPDELSHLPIIIHNREATDHTLAQLRDSDITPKRFVFHCFTGSPAEVEAILTFGAMVSFTGIVTFANAREVAEASDLVPLDRLMIETDSPFLAPEPHRKVRPNEPRLLPHVAAFLAQRRDMTVAALTEAVDANAQRCFDLSR